MSLPYYPNRQLTCNLILCHAMLCPLSRMGEKLRLRQPSLHTEGRTVAPSGNSTLCLLLHLVHSYSMLR